MERIHAIFVFILIIKNVLNHVYLVSRDVHSPKDQDENFPVWSDVLNPYYFLWNSIDYVYADSIRENR